MPLPARAQDAILPDDVPGADIPSAQMQQDAPDEVVKPRKRRDGEARPQGADQPRAATQEGGDTIRVKKRSDNSGQVDEATAPERRKDKSADAAVPRQSLSPDEQKGDATIRKRKLDADKSTAQSPDQGSKPDQARQRATVEKPRDQQNEASKPDQRRQPTTAEGQRDQQDQTTATRRPPVEANTPATNRAQTQPGANEARAGNETGDTDIKVRGKVNLAREAAPRIHRDLLRSGNRTDVAVDYAIGRPMSDRVQLAPMPTEIIDESPELRGYNYTVIEDQVVVVDPRTREVVEVIGADSRSDAAGFNGGDTQTGAVRQGGGGRESVAVEGRAPSSGGTPPSLTLSGPDRQLIRDGILRLSHAAMLNFNTGEQIPDQIPVEPIPDAIANQVPAIQQFDYFVTNERVVLVDPHTHSIVDVIQ
jgi:hypothetical protein